MPQSIVEFESELDQIGIPNQFCGLALYWWTIPDLTQEVKRLGGSIKSHTQKTEVCRKLYRLKPDAFEATEYELMKRDQVENERAKAKARSRGTPAPTSGQSFVGEQRRQSEISAGTTIAARRHQPGPIIQNGSGPNANVSSTSIQGAHSTRSRNLDNDRGGGGEDRVFTTRPYSTQGRAEVAPLLGWQPGPEYQSRQVQRPHRPEWHPIQHPRLAPLLKLDPRTGLARSAWAQEEHRQVRAPLQPALTTCEVCFDNITAANRLPRGISATCSHGRDVICRSCLEQHITAQSASQTWDSIICPQIGCESVLSYVDLQTFASPEVFERYDTFINRQLVEADPDFVPCSNPRCSGGGIVDAQSGFFFACSDCNTTACLKCKTAYHPGLSHEQNIQNIASRNSSAALNQRQEEQATKELIGKIAKPCPNTHCGINVQKAGGCDHMTCRACGQEFCWICLTDWRQIRRHGNRGHSRECTIHRRNDFLLLGEVA